MNFEIDVRSTGGDAIDVTLSYTIEISGMVFPLE